MLENLGSISKMERSNYSTERNPGDTSKYEREPTSEEFGMLSLANSITSEELQRLEVSKTQSTFPFPVPNNLLHIAVRGHPDLAKNESEGEINFALGHILIADAPRLTRELQGYPKAAEILKFLVLLHEVIHAAGFSEKNTRGQISRVGYSPWNWSMPLQGHEHMRGFNEGVVQSLAVLWANKHAEKISVFFKVQDIEDVKMVISSWGIYETECQILDVITDRIARVNAEEKQKVFDRIASGYFTGHMMHLRDIDLAFGKGSLRHLAALRSVSLPDNNRKGKEQHGVQIKESLIRSHERSERIQNIRAHNELSDEEYFLYLRRKYEHMIDRALIEVSELRDLDREAPLAIEMEKAYRYAFEIETAAKDALGSIRQQTKEHKRSGYESAVYENYLKYAETKRSLVTLEQVRLNLK